ncbi:MAG: cold shock domain-containing protein [candidate division WOR-3 bacterium]|nr:MAG: cold shock domain-containing protein [candidate division WOR-3 bacterium]
MGIWYQGLKGGNLQVYGKVKWFDGKKGYGFIENEDGSGDVFVHYADITGEGYRVLREGERVKFEISQTPKGSKAIKVERTDE